MIMMIAPGAKSHATKRPQRLAAGTCAGMAGRHSVTCG